MKFVILIPLLAICSFLLTYLIRRYALNNKIVSIPNERSLHSVPTPVGGGLAIILTWYTGISLLFFSDTIDDNLYFALLSGVILTIVGIIDDLIGLKPFVRLFFHSITAIIAFVFLGGLRALIIPGINTDYIFLIYPIVIVGIVWFINLYNFMDGVDGFASIQTMIICIVIYTISGNIINIVLIACVSGFLYWNWPKAKIFMGDVGSTQLGFILVVLGIYFHNTLEFSILNWIMILSPFWFDATYTLYRRWRNKEKLSQAHRKHAYQRIVQAGFSHQKVNLFLIAINVIIFGMILLYREYKMLKIPIFFVSLGFYYYLTKLVDKQVPFK